MRSSLVSATSLFALLLLEGRQQAAANPVVTSIGTQQFGYVLVTNPTTAVVQNDTVTISGLITSNTPGTGTISAATGQFSGGGIGGPVTATGSLTYTVPFTFAPSASGTFSDTVNGTYSWSASGGGSTSAALTLMGTGVAPVATGPSTTASAGYVLVGQSSTATINISNTGNGNKAGTGTAYNLNGSFGASGNSVFVGTGTATFSLTDNSNGSLSTSSASYGYTFKPTITGMASTSVVTSFTNGVGTGNGAGSATTVVSGTGVAPVQSVSPTSSPTYVRVGTTGTASVVVTNIGNGNLAGTGTVYNLNGSVTNTLGTGFASTNSGTISLASSATSTLGYTYTPTTRGSGVTSTVSIGFTNGNSAGTNLSQSVAATLTGVGVGPVYASATSVSGGSVTPDTPSAKGTLGSVGPVGATISFGTLGYKKSDTVYLELQNTTTDSAAAAALTNLTIDKYSISGTNASSVSISSLGAGSVITEGGMLLVPITVVNNQGAGVLNSTLTIFTDESVALGGSGDTFTYALTAIDVPEPASLAVLGAGLAGLASIRKRRKA